MIDEIEHLHVDLWNARAQAADAEPDETPAELAEPSLPDTALRSRLRMLVRRSETPP